MQSRFGTSNGLKVETFGSHCSVMEVSSFGVIKLLRLLSERKQISGKKAIFAVKTGQKARWLALTAGGLHRRILTVTRS